MQDSLRKNEFSAGHARAILSVSDARMQQILYHEILKKGLSVREAEKRAAALGDQSSASLSSGATLTSGASLTGKKSKTLAARDQELDAMQEKFITRLGTKVVINGDLNKGNIVIDYYSMEDLDRLYEILGGHYPNQ
jgi:ParB family chromosome partitioning protein